MIDGHSPYALNFDSRTKRYDALGFLVSNHLIKQALYQKVKTQPNITIEFEAKVSKVVKTAKGYKVFMHDDRCYDTPLLVAADSRFSNTRTQVGIAADMDDFARIAIVCRMQHETSHDRTAFECFHYGHTLAVLPLGEHESSIVITADTDKANNLLTLDEEAFAAFVCKKFKHKLGKMDLSTDRFSYPLIGVHANQFIKKAFCLDR